MPKSAEWTSDLLPDSLDPSTNTDLPSETTPLFSGGTGANPQGNIQSGAKRRLAFYLLSATLLIFGTQNSIILKYHSRQYFLCDDTGRNCTHIDSDDVSTVCANYEGSPSAESQYQCLPFEQPYYQAFAMFFGQSFCLLIFYVMELIQYHQLRMKNLPNTDPSTFHGLRMLMAWAPCLFDVTAQVMQNFGLILTSVSVYQMLRGAVVLFTGALARIFLHRRQYAFHWIAMILIVLGVVIVGLASVLFGETEDSDLSQLDRLLGDVLIILAQIFAAAQFVTEDYILDRYVASPMQLAGLQGVFGVIFWLTVLPIMQVTRGNSGEPGNRMDLKWAFYIFANFPSIWVSTCMYAVGIMLTNTSGLWITKIVSATSRATIDTFRTMFVWAISLALGWEVFLWLQLVGFFILVMGTMFYNEVVRIPYMDYSHVTSAFADIVPEDPQDDSTIGSTQSRPGRLSKVTHEPEMEQQQLRYEGI